MAPIEWPAIAPTVTSGRSSRARRRPARRPELAGAERQRLGRVGAVAADVEGQAVEPGGVEEDGHRQRPVAGRLPAVDEGDARARVRRRAPG